MASRRTIERQDLLKGLRAASATVVPFFLAWQWQLPNLSWAALAGWLTCLADTGGSRSRRALTMLGFGAIGAVLLGVGGWLTPHAGWAATALALVAFVGAMVRATGATGATLGLLSTIVMAAASSHVDLDPWPAMACFALGSVWATLLAALAWPIWTHEPLRHALAAVFEQLASYARETPSRSLRLHHRPIRAALETARDVALSLRARRLGESVLGSNLRALLGAAELSFFDLIALREGRGAHASELAELARIYTRIAALLTRPALTKRERTPTPPSAHAERLLARLFDTAYTMLHLAEAPTEVQQDPGSLTPVADQTREQLRESWDALRGAWSLRSPYLRHAVRVAATALVALLIGRSIAAEHVTWVSITALAVLQPYPGATLERAVERALGTVLGCLVTAALMLVLHRPWQLALVLFPLSVVAVYTKSRSYRLFTMFLTPVFVLVVDAGRGELSIALARAVDSGVGALIALVAGLVLLPSWESRRMHDSLAEGARLLRAYVDASCAMLLDDPAVTPASQRALRRRLGLALSEIESSLERLLAEPRRDKRGAHAALQRVTLSRRFAAAWTTLEVLRSAHASEITLSRADLERFCADVRGVLDGRNDIEHAALAWAPPVLHESFARILRLAQLLAALERVAPTGPARAGTGGAHDRAARGP